MYEDQHHQIAKQAALRWRAKGVKDYEFADLYQDAREIILRYESKYVPEKGTFEAFMMRICIRRLGDRLTRAVQPAGTASHSEIINLRSLRRAQVTEAALARALASSAAQPPEQPEGIHRLLWLKALRQRIAAIADDELALRVCLEETSVQDEADDPEERRKLHVRVRRVRRRLERSRQLLAMYRDGHRY